MTTSTNLDRANWANQAFRTFRTATGCDHEDSLGDLLTNLIHWADAMNFDFDLALERARGHYAAEIAEEAAERALIVDTGPDFPLRHSVRP